MRPRERFLAAARCQPTDTRPVWLMRQAGRFLPEYRAIRERVSFLDLCADPALACEVTLQPVRRFGVDAAIIFSDILVPIARMGQELTFGAGHGPRLIPPIRTRDDFARLHGIDPNVETPEVGETVSRVREAIDGEQAVIGFAGAPFTVFAYAVQGQGSRSFEEAKRLLFADPDLADDILSLLADVTAEYLAMQVRAGADAVQLFDTWTNLLSPDDFERFAAPYAARVLEAIEPLGVPRIYFPRGTGAYLHRVRAAVSCEVIGLDWTCELSAAAEAVGPDRAVQGNLDPTALLGSPASLDARVDKLLAATAGRPGHIFNLGHGVLPMTDPAMALRFVERVHERGRAS